MGRLRNDFKWWMTVRQPGFVDWETFLVRDANTLDLLHSFTQTYACKHGILKQDCQEYKS